MLGHGPAALPALLACLATAAGQGRELGPGAAQGCIQQPGANPNRLGLPRPHCAPARRPAERITDGERSVRAALREALAAPVLPAMGAAALGPFVPLFMAHVCAAMTHLAEPIR